MEGLHYPLEYSIQDLNILSSSGQSMNFKRLMLELSYYEDLYSFCTSGSLSVTDAQGFIENLQLTGNEFIVFNIGKIKDAPNNITETFRIYKIAKRKPSGNMNNEIYELFFCSEEMLLSEQIKISQAYSGSMITDIVNDILTNKLQVISEKIETIEQTMGIYDFIIPYMKPFEAISWLSTYARSNDYPGADMLFYQTKSGYNFRSLQSIYNDDIYGTYKYSTKNADYSEQQNEEKQISVQKYEFIKTYDSLNEVNAGTFANRLISIDPLVRSYYITDFDYSDYQSQSTTLNPNAPSNYYTNRLGNTQTQEYEGVLKVAFCNKDEMQVDYIMQRPGSVAKDIFIETYVPYRTAQISLANYNRIKMTIPGDPGITVGKTIQFNINSLTPTNSNKDPDKFYTGKYIVVAVRQGFTGEKYETILEIAKDSSPTQYQSINETSDWQEAITQ